MASAAGNFNRDASGNIYIFRVNKHFVLVFQTLPTRFLNLICFCIHILIATQSSQITEINILKYSTNVTAHV